MKLIREKIMHDVLIRGDREEIFDSIATSKGLDSWFTKGTELDPKPGGQIVFKWKDWGPGQINTIDHGVVLEYVKPEKFVFTWHERSKFGPSTVEMEFLKNEEGTVVTLMEYGYINSIEGRIAMMNCAVGWGEALTLLKFYVEHGLKY